MYIRPCVKFSAVQYFNEILKDEIIDSIDNNPRSQIISTCTS